MADEKNRKRQFPKAVATITSGKQARERSVHNKTRYQPGEIRTAQSPEPDRDRLDRALARASAADLRDREEIRKGQGQAGEVREATVAPNEEQERKETVRRFLRLAQERFKLAADAESHWRKDMLDDWEFLIGKQWPADIETQRTQDGRPCLVMNRLPQFVRQITNEQRQQRPSIQINPVGDGADQDTAEILQGVVRHIEVNGNAEVAYDTAFEHCAGPGLGWLRVLTDYMDDSSLYQEIFIKAVRNPFTVYDDPAATEPDRSDANWRFVIEDIPRDEYREKYPNSEAASMSDFTSTGDNAAEWATRDTIRVAEYFYVEEEPYTLYKLPGGSTSEEPPADQEADSLQGIHRTRRIVKWAKINAAECLEGGPEEGKEIALPGKYIPLVPVIGDDREVNGQRHISGLIRNAKDPQRMYNYWVSAATEMIALAPKAPFVGAEGQFKNHEKEWAESNVRNFAKLEYSPVTVSGSLVGPPQRQTFEPPVQSINLMTKQADLDLKTTTGIYDPSLGQTKPDQSGKAINLLQKQSDISTLNFVDNLSRSIRCVGRILIDYVRRYYPRAKVQRIINPDQSVKHVVIHNGAPSEAAGLAEQAQINRIYDIGQGDYDVTVTVGPSYQSKRQEAVASMMAMVQAYPDVVKIAGDLIVRNMDWPGHQEIADRIKKTLPPNLLAGNEDMDPEMQVQLLQAQLQQLGQQHAMLTEAVQKQSQVINEKQIEAQNKLAIEHEATVRAMAVAEIQTKAQQESERMKWEHEVWKITHQSAHELGMQADQQGHELDMAEQQPEPQTGVQ